MNVQRTMSSLFVFLTIFCSVCNAELVFIQLVWRHGDRTPIDLYPTDPNSEDVWEEGLGKLTVLGKKQHYALGKLLRKMYNNFTTGSPLEVQAMSSDCDRCMNSVESNLASFYAPSEEWKFDNKLDWQPFPIRYVPESEDRFLETGSYCPEASAERQRIINSPEGQELLKENEAMFQYLSNYSGKPIHGWVDASYLYDVLKIEKKYNLTLPDWTTKYWDQLHNVSDLSFFWSFNSPLMLRLRAGPLIGELKNNMIKKMSDKNFHQKVQIYSTHDTNVGVLLQALKVYNMKQPPYCATVIVELHQINSSYTVRFLYLNSSSPETGEQTPHVLVLNGCAEFCTVDYFINYTKNLIPSDWEAECKIGFSIFSLDEKSIALGAAFTAIIVFIIGVVSCILYKFNLRNKRNYTYHCLETSIN